MKGILIADAGSTKTDWSFLQEQDHCFKRIKSLGLNPLQTSEEEFVAILSSIKRQLEDKEIEIIFFYGAGCATEIIKDKVADLIKHVFKVENISVDSDLKGAAKALFGDGDGIVGILGTGSNSCVFKNGEIVDHIPALGYILGDEGSGSALGKRLINSIFKHQMPKDLETTFFGKYPLTLQDIILKTYKEPRPAKFLASFIPFLSENIDRQEIMTLIKEEFELYFRRNILPYGNNENLRVGFVGSVAKEFSTLLSLTAEKYNYQIKVILKEPISSLENYYKGL